MRTSHPLATVQLVSLVLLGSCSSTPKPPTVDASHRRPANTAAVIDQQTCASQLYNLHISAQESERMAASATATMQAMAAAHHPPTPARKGSAAAAHGGLATNTVFIIHFAFDSAEVVLPDEQSAELIAEARASPLILLRGRTDGESDSRANAQIAQRRAVAVRQYLVDAELDPSRIRATYQPSGDHVANNDDPKSRGRNRRVEVEIYRELPVLH
jgi:outer membrane protein OmpA-like peptidoglycan-associated protein